MKTYLKYLSILCVVLMMISTLSACGKDEKSLVERDVNDEGITSSISDEISSDEVQEAENRYINLTTFVNAISKTFKENDINSLKNMTSDDGLCIVSLYGGMAVLDGVSLRAIDDLQFKDGVLMTKNDPEVKPPEQEVGINASMFSDGEIPYITARTEGFLEKIDWSAANYDYLAAHFFSYYDQMVWTCVNSSSNDGWKLYQLRNNTYLYSNGYAWYSEDWQARVFVGQTFVIKRINNEYKIVAFIDVK